MHDSDTHHITQAILKDIASEKKKSVSRIRHLLIDKQNQAITRRFWELLDGYDPHHHYDGIYYCPECQEISLVKEPVAF